MKLNNIGTQQAAYYYCTQYRSKREHDWSMYFMTASTQIYTLLNKYRDLRVVFGWNKIRISLHTIFFTCEKSRMSVLIGCIWLADIFYPKMQHLFAGLFKHGVRFCQLTEKIYDILSIRNLERSWRNTFVISLTWNKPHGCFFARKQIVKW